MLFAFFRLLSFIFPFDGLCRPVMVPIHDPKVACCHRMQASFGRAVLMTTCYTISCKAKGVSCTRSINTKVSVFRRVSIPDRQLVNEAFISG